MILVCFLSVTIPKQFSLRAVDKALSQYADGLVCWCRQVICKMLVQVSQDKLARIKHRY